MTFTSLSLDKVRRHTIIKVRTVNTVYIIEKLPGGKARISGNDRYCPRPTKLFRPWFDIKVGRGMAFAIKCNAPLDFDWEVDDCASRPRPEPPTREQRKRFHARNGRSNNKHVREIVTSPVRSIEIDELASALKAKFE